MPRYQNISDFLNKPFGRGAAISSDLKYNDEYIKLVKNRGIRLTNVAVIGDSYYYHISVQSNTNSEKRYNYDVVIRFFTDKPEVAMSNTLEDYNIQLFSNSPGFMYKYSYLYKKQGFLIDKLFEKLDGDYEDMPPVKTNPNMQLSYDKSIYFAVRFLYERRLKYLSKNGRMRLKTTTTDKFFSSISDFQSVKFDRSIISEEQKLKKELDKKIDKEEKKNSSKNQKNGKITPQLTTVRTAVSANKSIVKKAGGAIPKKKASRSTAKKI